MEVRVCSDSQSAWVAVDGELELAERLNHVHSGEELLDKAFRDTVKFQPISWLPAHTLIDGWEISVPWVDHTAQSHRKPSRKGFNPWEAFGKSSVLQYLLRVIDFLAGPACSEENGLSRGSEVLVNSRITIVWVQAIQNEYFSVHVADITHIHHQM